MEQKQSTPDSKWGGKLELAAHISAAGQVPNYHFPTLMGNIHAPFSYEAVPYLPAYFSRQSTAEPDRNSYNSGSDYESRSWGESQSWQDYGAAFEDSPSEQHIAVLMEQLLAAQRLQESNDDVKVGKTRKKTKLPSTNNLEPIKIGEDLSNVPEVDVSNDAVIEELKKFGIPGETYSCRDSERVLRHDFTSVSEEADEERDLDFIPPPSASGKSEFSMLQYAMQATYLKRSCEFENLNRKLYLM